MTDDPELGPGSVLAGRYVLRAPLGHGGAASVWRAHDEVLGRDVAIKLLHPEYAEDPTAKARFVAEATAAAQLSHPNAVAIYDVGRTGARDHLVMELVDGPRLSDLLEEGRLDPGVVALLGREIGAALGTAHARGMVHRDVKPGNVLVTLDGHPKVVDFGLVRTLGDATSRLTIPGTVVGSARYVSPEQLRDEPPDARADVYSLGLILYEALTGRPPFGHGSVVEVAARRLSEDLEPAASLRPDAPAALTAAVDQAITRRAADRQADGAELAAQLAPLIDPQARARLSRLARRRAGVPATGDRADRARWVAPAEQVQPARPPGPAPSLGEPGQAEPDGTVAIPGRRRQRRWPALLLLVAVLTVAAVVGRGELWPTGRASGPVTVVDVGDLDPLGDGREHPDRAPLAIDGDLTTAWTTERYERADLIPPDKDGVGIWFDLGRAVRVDELTIHLRGSGSSFLVLVGDEPPAPDVDPRGWGTQVARVDDAGGEVRVTPTGAPAARSWLLWFTRLPAVEGGYQAAVADARFEGR